MSKSLAFLIGCESDVVMWGKRRGSCTVEGNAVEVNAMEVDAPEVNVVLLDDSFDERENEIIVNRPPPSPTIASPRGLL